MSGIQTGPFRLGDLVERFGGTLRGNPDVQVSGFATLGSAAPQHLSFLSNPRYRAAAGTSRAAALIVNEADAGMLESVATVLWIVPDAYLWFARVAQYFQDCTEQADAPGMHPSAIVDPAARIDPSAVIHARAVIGAGAVVGAKASVGAGCIVGRQAEVGALTRLHALVSVYDRCVIGQRCIVHSGAVIGADGFGFARDGESWVKIPQTGRVVIGDDVEIGANTTIDRGALDDTVIGNGVKLDNQIQVGHNVSIGDHTAIAGCVAIAGSVTIGRRCTIAGGVGIVGHVELADGVHVSAFTLVSRSIARPGQYSGSYPMGPHAEWEKNAAALRNLADLRMRLRAVERQLKNEEPE